MREEQTRLDGGDLPATYLAPPVCLFTGTVLNRDLAPGQSPRLTVELVLDVLDDDVAVPTWAVICSA
ncbi:hypothetical protein [Streptomyces sp. NBC_00568]|uniref:hypothetical protein n=1 Tax=Streptomyces sp. NBC_00568 TaxID=2975779 RepID=UPI0022576A8F|nr:hypothetical protein [Streptomyces sp. NBC_00568]MCX4993589.1 hypothetical protein [Streptomyces sp. NBC_00568]